LEYLKQQQNLVKQLISDHFDQHPDLKQQHDLLISMGDSEALPRQVDC
jgi:transposase